jgi:hypothetical protein
MDARALLGAYGGAFDVQLHDKLAVLTVLIKHRGGLPDERPVEANTQVNVIGREQRGATFGRFGKYRAGAGRGRTPRSRRRSAK